MIAEHLSFIKNVTSSPNFIVTIPLLSTLNSAKDCFKSRVVLLPLVVVSAIFPLTANEYVYNTGNHCYTRCLLNCSV
ncbi:Uncharacterised protein [Vibrio cholerae]|nr:Uncharacterised protein [Vibrio cholerae]